MKIQRNPCRSKLSGKLSAHEGEMQIAEDDRLYVKISSKPSSLGQQSALRSGHLAGPQTAINDGGSDC